MLREQFNSGQGIEECVLVCPVQDWIAFCQFLIGYEMRVLANVRFGPIVLKKSAN